MFHYTSIIFITSKKKKKKKLYNFELLELYINYVNIFNKSALLNISIDYNYVKFLNKKLNFDKITNIYKQISHKTSSGYWSLGLIIFSDSSGPKSVLTLNPAFSNTLYLTSDL